MDCRLVRTISPSSLYNRPCNYPCGDVAYDNGVWNVCIMWHYGCAFWLFAWDGDNADTYDCVFGLCVWVACFVDYDVFPMGTISYISGIVFFVSFVVGGGLYCFADLCCSCSQKISKGVRDD